MQDTSTQAMTEVALALSMAFFSLLIVALISIGLPQSSSATTTRLIKDKVIEEELKSVMNENSPTENTFEAGTTNNVHNQDDSLQKTFVFFYEAKFYTQSLATVLPSNLPKNSEIIVVLPKHTSVTEITDIQSVFATHHFELAVMSDDWFATLNAQFGG